MRLLLPVVLAGFLMPGTAVGQDPRLRARLAAPVAAEVERLVDSARAEGLPAEPLVQKALEGQTKGASGERIVAAVRSLGAALGAARGFLGPQSTVDELQAGVLWLRAGGSGAGLERLRLTAGGRSLAVPLAVTSEFVGRGWPEAEATATLASLLAARVSDASLLALRREVTTGAAGGGLLPALRAETSRLTGGRTSPP